MRCLTVLAVLSLAFPTFAAAGGDVERTMVEELLVITDVEGTLAGLRAQLMKNIESQLPSADLDEKQRERIARHTKKMMDLVFEELSYKSLKDEFIDAYVALFNQEEIAGLLSFYRSPTGQSFIRKMPALMARMNETSMVRMQKLSPRIQLLIDEFMADIEEDVASELEQTEPDD